MTTESIPNTAELTKESSIIVQRANALAVASGEEFRIASEELRGIKTYRKRVDDTFGPLVKSAHEAHKQLLATKATFDGPAAQAETIIKRKMGDWELAERKRAAEEERRLREEARKVEEERRLAEAEALEAQGQDEQAEAVIAAPAPAPVVVVRPDIPKVQGVSVRKSWKFRIVNAALIPRQYLIPDEKRIGEHARSMKETASIAGVEFYEEAVTSASGY